MTTWKRDAPAYGGYYETATVGGHRLMIRHTANGRWAARVDGKSVRGAFSTADAAKTAAIQIASKEN